jgi:hypothetical protein
VASPASLCWALIQTPGERQRTLRQTDSSTLFLLSISKQQAKVQQSTAAKAILFLAGDTVFLFKKEKNGVVSVSLCRRGKVTCAGERTAPPNFSPFPFFTAVI